MSTMNLYPWLTQATFTLLVILIAVAAARTVVEKSREPAPERRPHEATDAPNPALRLADDDESRDRERDGSQR